MAPGKKCLLGVARVRLSGDKVAESGCAWTYILDTGEGGFEGDPHY